MMKDLLLLHGALGSKEQFDDLSEQLSSSFRVHVLNFNGHGDTPATTGFNIESFTKDILNYIDQHKLDKVSIFGYSMGGYIALYLAQQHASRIEKIMTLGTKLKWNPEIATREIKFLNPDKIQEKVPEFALALEKRHRQNEWKNVLKDTADFMLDLGNNSYLSEIEQLEIPVQLALGDRDNMVSVEETREFFSRLKKGSLNILPHSPHAFEMLESKRLCFEIERFF